jgi:trehalose-phosphatase
VTSAVPEVTRPLITAYQSGVPIVLLFDYDGTLTPIVPHPWLAEISTDTRRLLQQLARRPGLHLGILSGRALDELIRMVGLADVYYGGTGGLELDLCGKRLLPPHAEQSMSLVNELARSLQTVTAGASGAWVENKPLGLTVHYRALSAALIPGLRERINHVLRRYEGQIRVLPGPMAIEITANLGWNKGTAVRMIVNDVGPDALALFAGDGANDADAIEAVRALGGITIGIGAQTSPVVTSRLQDPAALAAFLQSFLENVELLGSVASNP